MITLMVNKTNLAYNKTDVFMGSNEAVGMISNKFVGREFHQGYRVSSKRLRLTNYKPNT
jgi:hypothetical protein